MSAFLFPTGLLFSICFGTGTVFQTSQSVERSWLICWKQTCVSLPLGEACISCLTKNTQRERTKNMPCLPHGSVLRFKQVKAKALARIGGMFVPVILKDLEHRYGSSLHLGPLDLDQSRGPKRWSPGELMPGRGLNLALHLTAT